MTFHLMCVHIIFVSCVVAKWPSFGKELLTLVTVCSLCILTACDLSSLCTHFLLSKCVKRVLVVFTVSYKQAQKEYGVMIFQDAI